MKIYTLITKIMNGTVVVSTSLDSFTTKELAEMALNKVKELNSSNEFSVGLDIEYEIKESTLFSTKEEVPILNEGKLGMNKSDIEEQAVLAFISAVNNNYISIHSSEDEVRDNAYEILEFMPDFEVKDMSAKEFEYAVSILIAQLS